MTDNRAQVKNLKPGHLSPVTGHIFYETDRFFPGVEPVMRFPHLSPVTCYPLLYGSRAVPKMPKVSKVKNGARRTEMNKVIGDR